MCHETSEEESQSPAHRKFLNVICQYAQSVLSAQVQKVAQRSMPGLRSDQRNTAALPPRMSSVLIMGNNMDALTRGWGCSAGLQHFLDSMPHLGISGPYAASSSSRNSTCACTCASKVTEVSWNERSPSM